MVKNDIAEMDALALMRDRFHAAEEHESLNRIRSEDAIRFFWGEQWLDDIERQRKQDGRPNFTLNKLPAIIRQIINEGEANPPSIQVNPVNDGADEDTAEVLQGIYRHIENNGEGATVAYFSAYVYLVVAGFASWRVLHDYLPKSFDQDLFVERIANPFSVYWDPAAKKLDKSDARFCFVTLDLSSEEFKRLYPHSELVGASDFAGLGDRAPGWITRDGVRVVEYFCVEEETATLVKLDSGAVKYEDELVEGDRIAKDQDGAPITRDDTRRLAYRSVSNGLEWLEHKKVLPTDDIPIVTVTADELMVDGETRIKGAVHDLMEPQRLFNFNSSAIAETMALGTRAQWTAAIEQIEPFQAIWKQSNQRNIAVLPYKNVANVPPPQKIASEPPIQAMSAARAQSAEDLRSISGVYDATQANDGGPESGRAILARRRQTSTGNSHYLKNLGRGVKRTAQILLKYLPKIYDTPRVMRIVGSDQQPQQVIVHAGAPGQLPGQLPENIKGVFDLSVGNYDVTFTCSQSPETKRQESLEMLLGLCSANPAVVPIIGDLIVEQMDFSGKKAVVERLRRALPPQLQDNQNPTDPAQLQAHNSQLLQQNQTLMQQVQHITQLLQTKQIESASREKVEGMKLSAAEIRAQAGLEQERIKAQASILRESAGKQFDAVHDHALATRSENHAHDIATRGNVHQFLMATHQANLNPPAPEPVDAGQ